MVPCFCNTLDAYAGVTPQRKQNKGRNRDMNEYRLLNVNGPEYPVEGPNDIEFLKITAKKLCDINFSLDKILFLPCCRDENLLYHPR